MYNRYWKLDETDYGGQPYIFNIAMSAKNNQNFRTTKWTGEQMQLTLMSIPVGGQIGVEMHSDIDQLIRVESGMGMVMMGSDKDSMNYQKEVGINDVIFVPAGTWHNIINIGRYPLKLSSVYSPPAHDKGTIHKTKQESDEEEEHY